MPGIASLSRTLFRHVEGCRQTYCLADPTPCSCESVTAEVITLHLSGVHLSSSTLYVFMMSQLTNKSESVRKATSLRCRGENSDALRLLQQLSNEYPGDVELKIEIALCYSLQHRFDTIAEDMAGSDSDGNIEHKDRAICTLIVHYGRVHTDLRLQEAVAMCEAIAERWLGDLRLGSPGFGSQEVSLSLTHSSLRI